MSKSVRIGPSPCSYIHLLVQHYESLHDTRLKKERLVVHRDISFSRTDRKKMVVWKNRFIYAVVLLLGP
jgi:hypothetical protein